MNSDKTEWWHYARTEYAKAKKPQWRNPMPSKSEEKSQSRLWAMAFKWRDANGHNGSTRELMEDFITAWLRWSQSVPDEGNVSIWTLLTQFVEGQGQLDSGSPEAAVRVALKPMHKRAQMALLHKLMGELI